MNMNIVNVIPKAVEIVSARTETFSTIKWTTLDDAFNSKLLIIVNGQIRITVTGQDYISLGDWTDATIKQLVLTRLGLTEA
jgi:hypothetical protein